MVMIPLGPDTSDLASVEMNRRQQNFNRYVQTEQLRMTRQRMEEEKAAGIATGQAQADFQNKTLALKAAELELKADVDLDEQARKSMETGVLYGLAYEPSNPPGKRLVPLPTSVAPGVGGLAGAATRTGVGPVIGGLKGAQLGLRMEQLHEKAGLDLAKAWGDSIKDTADALKDMYSERNSLMKQVQDLTEFFNKPPNSMAPPSKTNPSWSMKPHEEYPPEIAAAWQNLVEAQESVKNLNQKIQEAEGRATTSQAFRTAAQTGSSVPVLGVAQPGSQTPSAFSTPKLGLRYLEEMKSWDTTSLKDLLTRSAANWDVAMRWMQDHGVDPDLYIASVYQELRRRGEAKPLGLTPPSMFNLESPSGVQPPTPTGSPLPGFDLGPERAFVIRDYPQQR